MQFPFRRRFALLLVLGLGCAGSAFAADPPSDARLSEAQRGLLVLGFNPGKTTGLVNPQTTKALEAFQQQQGLPVTGRADDATMARLRDKRDNNPNQVLGNPKTGAPDRRPAAAPAIEPHPEAIGPSVAVGGNALPDAPKEFNPIAGNPANVGSRPAAPSAAPPRLTNGAPSAAPPRAPSEAPVPIAAAPQEAVTADRVALPPGQSSGTLLERALDEAERGQSWLRWIWAPIAGLLVILAAAAWWRAGRSSNPYVGGGTTGTPRREPTLGSQER